MSVDGPESTSTRADRWGWLLGLAVVLILVPEVVRKYTPNRWLHGDGGFYLNMQKTLTWDGTLDQSQLHPHSWYEEKRHVSDAFSNIALGRNGEWWPKHSYMMPIAALPFYWAFGATGTLVFNVLMMWSMVMLGYRIARATTIPPPAAAAAVAALWVAATGPFSKYSYNFSNDGFYTVVAMAGVLLTLRRRPLLGGLCLGLAVWTKLTCVLLAPIALAALWSQRRDANAWARFLIGGAIPLLAYGAANAVMFGSPWVTSYQRVLVVNHGAMSVASHTDLFNATWTDGFDDLFFGDKHGLLTVWLAPVFGLLGIGTMLWRGSRAFALGIFVTFAVFVTFFARFDWYSERFLFPIFVLCITPTAVLIDQVAELTRRRVTRAQAIALGVAAATALVVLIGTRLRQQQNWRTRDHLEHASAYVGDRLCDYFNNMRWGWDCFGDKAALDSIGVNRNLTHTFKGQEARGYITAAGHRTRKPRRLVFYRVPTDRPLALRYGLDDSSKKHAKVHFEVLVNDEPAFKTRIEGPGTFRKDMLDLTPWSGRPATLTFVITSKHRHDARFVFDARAE